jgi:hypothetical protein
MNHVLNIPPTFNFVLGYQDALQWKCLRGFCFHLLLPPTPKSTLPFNPTTFLHHSLENYTPSSSHEKIPIVQNEHATR